MPFTVNGIGTATVPGVGFVRWGSEDDCDAVECFVVVYLPLIPLKPTHTFDWSGNQYRFIPIQWSFKLVAKAFAWRWLTAFVWLGSILAVIGGLMYATSRAESSDARTGMEMLTVGVPILLAAFPLWKLMTHLDRRDRDLRLVLGPHSRGSSDPATWSSELLAELRPPQELYGAPSYLVAARNLMGEGRVHTAMWAARLAVAKEDPLKGEELTDEILAHKKVRESIDRIAADPSQWQVLLADPPRVTEDQAAAGG